MTLDRDPATRRWSTLQVPEPELPTKTPAGRRSSTPEAPGGQPDPSPVIMNSAAVAQALCDHFLTNADRGDHAANDELIAELLRRIRARQVELGVGGEHVLHVLPDLLVLTAEQQRQPPRRVARGEQPLVKPALGVPVLGEDDHTFRRSGNRFDSWVRPAVT